MTRSTHKSPASSLNNNFKANLNNRIIIKQESIKRAETKIKNPKSNNNLTLDMDQSIIEDLKIINAEANKNSPANKDIYKPRVTLSMKSNEIAAIGTLLKVHDETYDSDEILSASGNSPKTKLSNRQNTTDSGPKSLKKSLALLRGMRDKSNDIEVSSYLESHSLVFSNKKQVKPLPELVS